MPFSVCALDSVVDITNCISNYYDMIYGFIILAIGICGLVVYMRSISKRIDDVSGIKETYSFSEYMDLLELPVLVMTNNDKKLRFILDSGSNGCHIDKAALEGLDIKESSINKKSCETATGGGVISSSNEKCILKLHLKKYVFEVPFSVDDMGTQFDFIKSNDGVQLHGILGSNFLTANDWVLDFAENIAYMKDKK